MDSGPLVYVDQPIFPWRGRMWCHMWSTDLDALHGMARRIGMRREWFQGPPKATWLHYDVTAERRARAIGLGAVVTDKYGAREHVARMQGDVAMLERIEALRARLPKAPERALQLSLL